MPDLPAPDPQAGLRLISISNQMSAESNPTPEQNPQHQLGHSSTPSRFSPFDQVFFGLHPCNFETADGGQRSADGGHEGVERSISTSE